MPVVMFVVIVAMLAAQSKIPSGPLRAFGPLVLLFWPILGFIIFMTNAFGVDCSGFRALVLLPTPRWKYLLAKNLALFPFVGGLGALFVIVGGLILRLPVSMMFISLTQVVQVYLLISILGNFISLRNPFPLKPDSMRMSPGQGAKVWINFLGLLFMPVILAPSALCMFADSHFRYFGVSPGMLMAVIFLALTTAAYKASLTSAGQQLMQREQKILEAVVRGDE